MKEISTGQRKVALFDLELSAAARREVDATLDSGWLTSGPRVRKFERAVARMLKVKGTVAVGSGTAGLHLALAAFGGLKGREVITSPYTFVATPEAIMFAGGKPVFADIDPATLTLDPDEVARKISKKTAAVMPVDVAGYPSDYARLNELCDSSRLLLVSDAAHAIGAAYRRRSIPRLCDAAVYSFYSTKNLTCGEGGMVATRHDVLAEKIRLMARHGLSSGTYERRRGKRWDYDGVEFGYKATMSEVHAAIGLGELEVFKENQARRTAVARRYEKNLRTFREYLYLPRVAPHYRHGWHLYIIKLALSRFRVGRDRFIREMAARGVECGVHYKPIFELSWYRDVFKLAPRFFPNATWAWQRAVSLPMHPLLSDADVDYVCDCIGDVIQTFRR